MVRFLEITTGLGLFIKYVYASFHADFCCCDSISFLKIKLNLKVEEIYRQKSTCSYKFLGKNVIASGFYLVSSKMKRFTKIVNR